MGMACKYCGNLLNGGAKFCPTCGAPVETEAQNTQNTVSGEQIEPDMEPYISEEPDFKISEIPVYEPDKDIKSMFMRHDNRLNRQRFIARSLGLFVLVSVIMGVLLSIAELLQSPLVQFFTIIVSFVFMIPSFKLIIRRLHDLNRPGWWCIGTMLPGINIVFAIYLVLFIGTNGPNQYGPDPLYEPD